MAADQAAGLRRRSELHPLRCIHCYSDSAASSAGLVHALHRLGQVSLLIDMHGRILTGSSARSLFDWRQQLARGRLHLQPTPYGDAWYAPGVSADEPDLRHAAQAYDFVLFDAAPDASSLFLMPDAAHYLIMEVQPTHASMQYAYARLKTLSHAGVAADVGLLGDAAACDRVRTACRHFVESGVDQAVYSAAREDDAFAALAVRMAAEEANRNGSLQHRETLNGR